ncbi:hypothetical protein JCM15519_07280 [Fundidesulfovibrio butyratiphilus]
MNPREQFFKRCGVSASNVIQHYLWDLSFADQISTIVQQGFGVLKWKGMGKKNFERVAFALEALGYVKNAHDWMCTAPKKES